jgi:hypothetical protein
MKPVRKTSKELTDIAFESPWCCPAAGLGDDIYHKKGVWNPTTKSYDEDATELHEAGWVGVDSASVTVRIHITDIGSGLTTRFSQQIFTPDGDGSYRILAGRIKGLGRCLVVAFDLEQDEDEGSSANF